MRSHVIGDGPGREYLPNFQKIGQLPDLERTIEEIIATLIRYDGQNDVNTDRYTVSQVCSLTPTVPNGFINLLLQDNPPGTDGTNEKNYTVWNERSEGLLIRKFIQSSFPAAYRTRIAVLPAGGQIDWHIDTNTSVSCRFHIPITNLGSKFQVRRQGKEETGALEIGGIHFTNTGYPHRVFNPTDKPRVSVLFGIDHQHVASLLPPFEKPRRTL